MALRQIHLAGDPVLEKHCRTVVDFDDRLKTLLDDMTETLMESGGVGLAAPQVGILRRVVVVLETNVTDEGAQFIIELVNPEIVDRTVDLQTGPEGCLSLPGKYGVVTRPESVKVRAQDRNGKTFEYIGESLTARCFCHEIDHLDGILFTQRAERMLTDEEINGGE